MDIKLYSGVYSDCNDCNNFLNCTNKEICDKARYLYNEAIRANTMYHVLLCIEDAFVNNSSAMEYGSCFYSTVVDSLQESIFMIVARMYDNSKDVVTIRQLLLLCINNGNYGILPEYCGCSKNGTKIKFHHILRSDEKWQCKYECDLAKSIGEILDCSDDRVCVDFTSSEFLDFFVKQLRSLSKISENVRNYRNKIYAHNVIYQSEFLSQFFDNNKLLLQNVCRLIEYALDVSRFVLGSLTYVMKPDCYVNEKDFENILAMVNLGIKYSKIIKEDKHE